MLKPLKGSDKHTASCLQSWLDQNYSGEMEVLFGVASPDDSAAELVRQLIEKNPTCDARLVVCPHSLGVNGKVSSLVQMARQAKYDIIAVSDADVHVPKDYLVNAVALLKDPEVGLVNSFYRLANPTTLAMHCEAVAINADFWSQVLQGRSMQPLDFALGAVMVVRCEQLEQIGGLQVIADYLADDFQLGQRIVRAGKKIAICPVAVDCISPPMSWKEVWDHQLRWSRTIRVCKPLPYAASVIGNPTLWPLLWLLASPSSAVAGAFGFFMLARMSMARMLQKRFCPQGRERGIFWMPPVKDMMHFSLWLLAHCGNDIQWRGVNYRLQRDGRLVRA